MNLDEMFGAFDPTGRQADEDLAASNPSSAAKPRKQASRDSIPDKASAEKATTDKNQRKRQREDSIREVE